MKGWSKAYFTSFFSNKDAKEMRTKSFWNVVLSLLMYIIILTAFYSFTYRISFSFHLNNSSSYMNNVVDYFYKSDNEIIDLKIEQVDESNQLKAYLNGESLEVINTYYSSSNPEENELNIIIDTRDPYLTFFDFNFIKDDITISKDDYLILEDKSDYTLNILDNTLISLDINQAKDYLQDNSDYLNLDSEKREDSRYITKYYLLDKFSDVFTSEYYLPNPYYSYYYKYYRTDTSTGNFIYNNFIVINSIFTFTNFSTDKNIEMYYIGYYSDFDSNYQLLNSSDVDKNFLYERLNDFFNNLFQSSMTTATITRGYALFSNMPYVLIMMLITAFFIYLFCKINKQNYASTYTQAFKITSSFILFSAIITGLFSIITSYMYSTATVVYLGFGLFCLLMIIRSIIFIIFEFIRFKKNPLSDNDDIIIKQQEYHSTMDEVVGNNLNLKAAASSKKIIENDVNDDDVEKMELE